jgi:hypothetical protein
LDDGVVRLFTGVDLRKFEGQEQRFGYKASPLLPPSISRVSIMIRFLTILAVLLILVAVTVQDMSWVTGVIHDTFPIGVVIAGMFLWVALVFVSVAGIVAFKPVG